MAVSVTTRPNTWSAVKNPVVYTFTSTGHGALVNYRIEVEVFKASDDTSLTGGVKFSFTPDADGISYVDISTIVKAYLAPEWTEPASLNVVETDTSLKVYIKYQELYDGSATSVVDDVANPFHCVFGGLQILDPYNSAVGNNNVFGNSLIQFVPANSGRRVLYINNGPKIWRDYPATLSFIFPDALSNLYVFRTQYDESGALLSEDRETLDLANDDAVNRLDLFNGLTLSDSAKTLAVQLKVSSAGTEVLSNPGFDVTMAPWTSEAPPVGTAWTAIGGPPTDRITVNTQASESIQQDITEQAAGWYYLAWKIDTHLTDQGTLTIEVWNNGVLAQTILDIETPINTATTIPYSSLVQITEVFDELRAYITYQDGVNRPFNIGEISLKPETLTEYTNELTFDVADPCDNPVLLFWKNSVGGDAFWLFEHGQEMGYSYSGRKKAKRMTLFAEHLTLNQWEALNELNTIGEIYAENIQEFTSSVNKSHVRDGAQVYVVDTDGSKTGVIVIPSSSVINTKDEVHSISIEIEFPERIE